MKIDLTCPVELWQYAMPTDTDAECTFGMNNLSQKVVTSVQATLACYDQNDELLFRQTERVQGLKAGAGERFTITIQPSEWNAVEGVDLVVEKVWFDDATVWRKGNAPLVHYTPNAIPAGRALDDLRFVAGKDAVGYPQTQDQVWLCVCGRANALESERCCRCERRRDAVFASFSRENVKHVIDAHEKKLSETARKAREDNNILQENQEKQRIAKQRKHKRAVRLAITLGIVAALAVASVVWGLPALRYHTAAELLTDGQYDQAADAFRSMDDYRDAKTQVQECDYQKALSLMDVGDEASVAEAEHIFFALDDYRDSETLSKQASYELAGISLEEGNYEAAASRYQSLGSYQDSADKLKQTTYRQAEALYDAAGYQVARVLFQGLGGYQDAAARAQACAYELAKADLASGGYQTALDELLALGDYEDAPTLVKQAYYALAEEATSAEAYEEAGNYYLLAGDYEDAQAKANDCLYRLAQSHKANGEYDKALALFLRVPDYLDSEGQARSCLYEKAVGMIENEEYAEAAALLETIPTYEDAQSKLDECRFVLAQKALDAGDAEQAERLLDSIVDYRGSETQLRKVRYQLAENDFAAADYQSALPRYTALGDYRDSKAKVKRCRYELANAALSAGEYSEAITAFAALGAYRESKALLEDAQYRYALALRGSGDNAAAAQVLEEMTSSRARDMLMQLRLAEGQALAAEGKYDEAIALYQTLGRSTDVLTQINACRYALAQQLLEAGDLPAAGEAFQALGNYQDAKAQSEACFTAYYGQVAQAARDAMEQQDYVGVVRVLSGFEMGTLSKTYSDLPTLYAEACYNLAEERYRDGKPMEALPFYQAAGDYRDADVEKLERNVYLILGDWQSVTGKTAVFRMDGTCDLMGEALCYQVQNLRLFTGETSENLVLSHKISSMDKTGMSLRDIRDGQDVVYKFTRVGDFALPQPDMVLPEEELSTAETDKPESSDSPAEEDGLEELLVREDGDEPQT